MQGNDAPLMRVYTNHDCCNEDLRACGMWKKEQGLPFQCLAMCFSYLILSTEGLHIIKSNEKEW